MNRRQLLSATGVAAVMAATTAPVPVQAGTRRGIVGSWFGTVTAENPPLGQFNDLISFLPGGVVVESRRYLVSDPMVGNLLETTGHGAWERRGGQSFEAFFRFLLQDADSGAAFGTDDIRLRLELERATDQLTGTFESQIKDVADNVLLTVTGNYSAKRIVV